MANLAFDYFQDKSLGKPVLGVESLGTNVSVPRSVVCCRSSFACAPYPPARPIFPALKLACQRARNITSKLRFIIFCDLPLRPPDAEIDHHPHSPAVSSTAASNGAHYRFRRRRAQEHSPQARAAHCRARGQILRSWRGFIDGTGQRPDDSDGAARCR